MAAYHDQDAKRESMYYVLYINDMDPEIFV